MPLAREQRKLAAIIAADVVGYSRLMGRDESGTLARLHDIATTTYSHRSPATAALLKLAGDGALFEFVSAVNALSAATECPPNRRSTEFETSNF
jgi:class 3 adenylate cyclase